MREAAPIEVGGGERVAVDMLASGEPAHDVHDLRDLRAPERDLLVSERRIVCRLVFQVGPPVAAPSSARHRMHRKEGCAHSRSDHCSQSRAFVFPSSPVTFELGLVPSRCSSTATTYPRLAISPQNAEYMSREQPTPWLNIISGHLPGAPDAVGGGVSSGASFVAGKVVPQIAAAAMGSGGET